MHRRVSLKTTDPSGTFNTGSGTAKVRISIGNTGCVSNINIYPSTTAEIIKGTLQTDPGAQDEDDTFTLSLYLNGGMTDGSTEFGPGTLTISGTFDSLTTTGTGDDITGINMNTTSSQLYLTHEVTDYQKSSVAWELYDYAVTAMERLAYPTYHFSVESANFLVLDEFYEFAQNFKIGDKIYLHLPDGVISPVVIGASIDFDDPSAFSIEFSDSYTTNDKSFSLESLLDKAVSMGHNLDLQQYNYSSFVNSGANTSVKQFMDSAIDTMKNNIISGTGNEITIDQTGIRARKSENGTYSDKQLWISNNSIMLTKDAWVHAEVGIGEFKDNSPGAASGATVYGIAAPLLVGRIVTGNNLIIESDKKDGGVSVFKVDSEGASLHNATFNLYGSKGGRIEFGTAVGIVGGANKDTLLHYDTDDTVDGVRASDGSKIPSVADIDSLASGVTPNANFWLDMNGGAFFKGKILADSGSFGGWTLAENKLWSGSGSTYVALSSSTEGVSNLWPADRQSVTTGHYLDNSGTDMTDKPKAYKTPKLTVRGNTVYSLTYTVTHGTSHVYLRIHEYDGNTLIDMPIEEIDLKGTNNTTETNSVTFTTDADADGLVISVESYDYISTTSGNLILREENDTLYAIWAGDGSAARAPFSVKRDGTVTAKDGTFGNIEVETVSSGGQTTTTTKIIDGALSIAPASGGRSGGAIYAGAITSTYQNKHKFEVDENGDVWMTGSIHMPASGSITWANGDDPVHDLATGTYTPTVGTGETTFISGKVIYSPTIIAGSGGFQIKADGGASVLTINNTNEYVNFGSTGGYYAYWYFPYTFLSGNFSFTSTNLYFNGSNVSGLQVTIPGLGTYPVTAASA